MLYCLGAMNFIIESVLIFLTRIPRNINLSILSLVLTKRMASLRERKKKDGKRNLY